jgi:FkbM family methyltransferase
MKKIKHTIFNNNPVFFREEKREADLDVFNEVVNGDCYLMEVIKSFYTPLVVVDVGAHIGSFSLLAKRAWPNAKIFAVEPEKENVELLKANLHRYPNAYAIDGAVSYLEDKVLVRGKNATGGNHLVSKSQEITNNNYERLEDEIKLYKLKDIATFIDCLKMDCEGGEYEILEYESKELLEGVKITLGEYHGCLDRFKPAIEKAMPHMRMFYTGPGNTMPYIKSNIGNFWGFSKDIKLPEGFFSNFVLE